MPAANAHADSLFMEVDAYVIHGKLLLWKPGIEQLPIVYHVFEGLPTRLDLLS